MTFTVLFLTVETHVSYIGDHTVSGDIYKIVYYDMRSLLQGIYSRPCLCLKVKKKLTFRTVDPVYWAV